MADEKSDVYNEFIDYVSERMEIDLAIQSLGKTVK